jgi:hypothetical protein
MPDDLAAKIITDASAARLQTSGGTSLVAGIQGEAAIGGMQRLYLDPGLTSYVELAEDAVITSQELSSGGIACTGVWCATDTPITYVCPIATTAKNVSVPQLAKASGAAFRAAAAPNGAGQGTARFGIFEVGAGLWGVAGALGWQDDIIGGIEDAAEAVGSFFGNLFG